LASTKSKIYSEGSNAFKLCLKAEAGDPAVHRRLAQTIETWVNLSKLAEAFPEATISLKG